MVSVAPKFFLSTPLKESRSPILQALGMVILFVLA